MKIPETIIICGQPHKVILDPTSNGGGFDCVKREITIGTEDPKEIEENLVHEVCEAILAIRDYRYVTERGELDNSDYRFFFNHKEFELFARDLAIALHGLSFTGSKKK